MASIRVSQVAGDRTDCKYDMVGGWGMVVKIQDVVAGLFGKS